MESKIFFRTKEIYFAISVIGMVEIRSKELEHAVQDLIEGWAKRHNYGASGFDCTVRDTSEKSQVEYLADIAKEDQEAALKGSAS